MSDEAMVTAETDGPIGWIVFDHQARRNAMTMAMWEAVPAICRRFADDDEIRVVILRGAGEEAFVAGADISEFADHRQGQASVHYDLTTAAATDAIEALPKPTLALIHGFCIGGGLALAAAADVRYGSDDAVFGLPPARLGIGYRPEGMGKLVDLLGPSVTKEIVYTAEWFDASTALRWGLINHLVPKGDLDRFVSDQATIMAGRAPLSQRAAKMAVADHLLSPARRRPDEVRAAVRACFESDDYAEGVAAFMQRRAPVFRGR